VMLSFTPGSAPNHSEIASPFRPLGIAVRRLFIIAFVIRVVDPLRDIAGHIVQTVGAAAGVKGAGSREILVPILTAVHVGGICHEFVSPGVSSPALATA